jgi:hypothetical protein
MFPVGSNLSLKDRTLNIKAKKPLRQISNLSNTTQLRGAVNDIRTLYVSRDQEFMTMLDNIRGLHIILENQSSAEVNRRSIADGRHSADA